jgi:hypothetical protein
MARLIDWNVDVLLRLLKLSRCWSGPTSKTTCRARRSDNPTMGKAVWMKSKRSLHPKFDAEQPRGETLNQSKWLRKWLPSSASMCPNIAAMYQDNPFHNFEHASQRCPWFRFPSDKIRWAGRRYRSLRPLNMRRLPANCVVMEVYLTTHSSLWRKQTYHILQGKEHRRAELGRLGLDLLMGEGFVDLRAPFMWRRREGRQLVVNSVMATDVWTGN